MISNADLTRRQQQVLNFISDYTGRLGFPPTISEIQKHFSFRSPNAVKEHLTALEKKGRIRRHPYKSRGLEIKGSARNEETKPTTMTVPLVGRVSAGVPILATQNIDAMIAVDASLVHGKGALFALKVQGDSMIKAGIYHGDIVIVCQQSSAQNGEIIVALLGEEATVKRFLVKDGVISLKPENDALEPISVSRREDFRVLGKVVATLRRIDS